MIILKILFPFDYAILIYCALIPLILFLCGLTIKDFFYWIIDIPAIIILIIGQVYTNNKKTKNIMKICSNRCSQCGTKYQYQASGEWRLGYDSKLNSPYYCPDCQSVINHALSTIDRKFEEYWQKTDVVDTETLLKWRQENREQHRQEFSPRAERVFANLYNSDKSIISNTHEIEGREQHKNKIFRVYYWSNTSNGEIRYDEPINITIKMEKNLITGKILPWID